MMRTESITANPAAAAAAATPAPDAGPRQYLIPGIPEKSAAERSRDSLDLGGSDALRLAERLAETLQRGLRFRKDEETGRMTAEVLDGRTGEVIRTIPPEDVLKLTARLAEAIDIMFGHRGDPARPAEL